MSTTTAPALPLSRLHTARELSDSLGLPLWRVYELVREDAIPHVRVGRSVRFRADAVAAWLDEGGTGYDPPAS